MKEVTQVLKDLFNNRIKALGAFLEEEDLEGYLVANEHNILYFTGFLGGSRLLIPREGENILYVHGVSYESARQVARNCRVELVKRGKEVDEEIADQMRGLKLMHVGFDAIDASAYLKLAKASRAVKLEAKSKLVWRLREVKDETELRCMRSAAKITSDGMKTALETLREGWREYELAAEIEYSMRKSGSDGVAFETIVASGGRSAFPHGGCTDREIRRGDLVILDVGAKYRHYRADLTRTVTVGKPSPKHKKIYEIVREAQQKAFQSLKAEVRACDADAVARGRIESAGYGKYFVHSLGHGIGLNTHEPPRLSPENKETLKTRNVVTVEPGIYIVDFGGIRIEDTVLLHTSKAERLTKAPYSLEVKAA